MTDEELIARLREVWAHEITIRAADRIAALRAERDEAECEKDRLAEINRNLCNSHNILLVDGSKWQTRAETAEAKLAKAVEALERAKASIEGGGGGGVTDVVWLDDPCPETLCDFIDATLAEIKGESHE